MQKEKQRVFSAGEKKTALYDLLPFTAATVILILCVLAFFHMLYTGVTLALIVVLLLLAVLFRRSLRADLLLVPALVLILVAAVLTAGRVVNWWDDINFWASDAKALWATHGFAGRYGNVSPAFGDYPPAQSLWKWLFLSLSPRVYREGLQLAAYQVLNMLFLLPLLKYARGLRPFPVRLLAVPAVFLLPGAVCALQFQGAAADITMGLVYGALLLAMCEPPSENLRLARIVVYASLLMLIKDTGFLWAFFALLFWLFVCDKARRPSPREALVAVVVSGGFLAGWLVFCIANRRIAKLTGEALRMARGGFHMPEDAGEKLRVFLYALLLEPLHGDRTAVLDLSAAAMAGFIIITCVILMHYTRIPVRSGEGSPEAGEDTPMLSTRCLGFLLLTGIITYGAILAGHLSVFSVETQYLDPFEMAKSISRYGAPWTLGGAMLMLAAGLSRGYSSRMAADRAAPYLALAFLLLCADYPGEARGLLTWRQTKAADLQARETTLGEPERAFLAALHEAEEDGVRLAGRRVLFLRDGDTEHSVKDAFLSYEASPVAVVYADYWPDMEEAAVQKLIEGSKAGYLYRDGVLSEIGGGVTVR